MTAPTAATVRVTRRFAASPERVFDAWLDPAKAGRFLFATAGGKMVRAEIDARVGGRYVFVDRRDGDDVEHTGEYLEIDRPRRLVFTLVVPKFSSIATRVTIDIVPAGRGCELTLTHEGVLPDYAERTGSGWTTILSNLASVISRKAAATSFLTMVAAGRVAEAFASYIGKGFRHHNPFFEGTAEALMRAMEENARQNPQKLLEVHHALEDGDFVAVHSHVRQKPDDRGAAVVHIFRFENDQVVELWDVGQPLPEASPNEHGMF